MSNGDMDSNNSKNVLNKLLLIMKRRGRLPMLSLSDYAKDLLTQHPTESTRYSSLDCPSLQRSSRSAKNLQKRVSQTLETFSDTDLARMDKAGIEVLGLRTFVINEYDTTWAK